MADMRWTPGQEDAIQARNGTVLVAAAAGSGKTAVLVQRAIERLTGPGTPRPGGPAAHRHLYESRGGGDAGPAGKSGSTSCCASPPRTPFLRRQSILLSQAHIGTVDSFCAEMAREFFHLLDIAPDFKIVSDKQEEELMDAALLEAVSAAFESGAIAPPGRRLLRGAGRPPADEHGAHPVRATPSPTPSPSGGWRKRPPCTGPATPPPWERVILEYAKETAEYGVRLLTAALEAAAADPKLEEAFAPAMHQDREACQALAALGRRRGLGRRKRGPAGLLPVQAGGPLYRGGEGGPPVPAAGELPPGGEKSPGRLGRLPGRHPGGRAAGAAGRRPPGGGPQGPDFGLRPAVRGKKSGTGAFWTTAIWSTAPSGCSAGRTAPPPPPPGRSPPGSRRS